MSPAAVGRPGPLPRTPQRHALLLNELTLLGHAARQEPLGRVLLEAAAAGVAVVATDVGGTREIFPTEADAARLVPPDDAATLAAAMLELLGKPDARSPGAAARQCAEEAVRYSQERWASCPALRGRVSYMRGAVPPPFATFLRIPARE